MREIPRIHIEQQAARIGIQTTNAKVEVNSSARPKMRIVTERPRMEIERKTPSFKVEPQRGRADKPALTRYQRATLSAAQQANTPRPRADITLKADALIPNTAADVLNLTPLELNKAIGDYAATTGTGALQQHMPSIEWEAGYVNISWSNAQMQIEWDQGDYLPSFSVEPHSVEIYLREKPYIKITVSDEVIAAMYGPQTDEKI